MDPETVDYIGVFLVGGRYDGVEQFVEAGPDGLPPEIYLLQVPGQIHLDRDPTRESVLDIVTLFYERAVGTDPDGRHWVYLFRGEDTRKAF